VDQADQLRANFTCHRKQNYYIWMPLFYWLVDIVCVNAYLLWKWSSIANSEYDLRTHIEHRIFISTLYTQLLHSNDKIKEMNQSLTIPTEVLPQGHKCIQRESYGRCE
jgi:hypothetical protein